MTKKLGLQLMVVGLAAQVIDVATDGKLFSAGGVLAGVDRAVPKVTLPWPPGVQTNIAFWVILAGAVIYFTR